MDAIIENIKISAKDCISHCEEKRHKTWFDEECSKLVDRRRLQDQSLVNEDNLSNVRRVASRYFRNKKGNI
jgi:hypothetical protein